MKSIIPAELHSLLVQEPGLVLFDVRTPVEFAEMHIAEARNVPLDRLDPEALRATGPMDAGRPTYLVCHAGVRAEKAAAALGAAGATNTVVVAGGILGWVAAGLPVERGTSRIISLERQVRIAAGLLVFTGVILGWRVHPAFYGLSGFVGAGLIFSGITDSCGMGLLLARAPWNQLRS